MDASVIYPHQLFKDSPAIAPSRKIYLVEEPLLLTHNPIHRQRLLLHKLSLDAYQTSLEATGHSVIRLTIAEHPQSADVFFRLKNDGVTRVHIVDTVNTYLEKAIVDSLMDRVWYESPMFILEKADAQARFVNSKRLMASFYKKIRLDKRILLESDTTPTGGQWSFDKDNRKKIPKGTPLPEDIIFLDTALTQAAAVWVETIEAEKYGAAKSWLPYTHVEAEKFLQEFLSIRFQHFGDYEDAMTTHGTRLWHSTLSPLLNIGLLTAQQVITHTLAYAEEHSIPLNSLEGFVRQIIGWREFIRASYETDGSTMRQANFFNHTRKITGAYWTGDTGIFPVDTAIHTALEHGYNHHIERLMVMGNMFLLTQTHPDAVYQWFMGMYVDAYDWVMVPNVYGMSQFADGGSFATKPYISGANYLKKMSDYPGGDWEDTWTALYWNFIHTHREFFTRNHRLSMMPRLLEKMAPEKKQDHLKRAQSYLDGESEGKLN
jgi:deoxyribodipyrimidine photolyase-related protein